MSLLRFSLLLLFCSCAVAVDGDSGETDDSPDAAPRSSSFPDAGPQADAGPPAPDAAVISIDAAPLGIDAAQGPFCDNSGQCTVSGECCFSLGGPGFCTPGTDLGGVCIPD